MFFETQCLEKRRPFFNKSSVSKLSFLNPLLTTTNLKAPLVISVDRKVWRSLPPHIQEVACDHMSYFSTDVGLQALLAALTQQR
ncbi:hypothetical protein G7B40_035050 [Aetokthonos hydrillicola Thurmond2011]|jgi:hypothetical protein|uniref:Uncharacterized protein n=1 Tax=Aetokthonos hydrillicola Thurmond2011 TaxID=2712845 RepID=A0AAP5IFZ6_9CYAN|nr:hypothetical protein [Aetokthonos hydrillicola]MBO3463479.1 hypothetical protein [Aetokthonos hydrillicola CCALA 1050]MBW4590433.1 hypothetical protein [Aetokthonos hydrillicola CCALA 1050]MDR9899739.1 hypothetical protein [Aetokthonos hydrillicola Thurmond2011]